MCDEIRKLLNDANIKHDHLSENCLIDRVIDYISTLTEAEGEEKNDQLYRVQMEINQSMNW